MKILAFDTATRATTVALWESEAVDPPWEERDDPGPSVRPGHTRHLLPLAAELLRSRGWDWNQVQRLAVGTGPGTFTGLRIGIATARALSRARGIELVGVSTLESLALGAVREPGGSADADTVLAVLDARRGEAFAATWPVGQPAYGSQWPCTFGPAALGPSALSAVVPALGSRVLAVGDGAVEFREVLERSGASIPEDNSPLHRVSATNHCRLALNRRAGRPDEVSPEYVRLPDAEIARRHTRRP